MIVVVIIVVVAVFIAVILSDAAIFVVVILVLAAICLAVVLVVLASCLCSYVGFHIFAATQLASHLSNQNGVAPEWWLAGQQSQAPKARRTVVEFEQQ